MPLLSRQEIGAGPAEGPYRPLEAAVTSGGLVEVGGLDGHEPDILGSL